MFIWPPAPSPTQTSTGFKYATITLNNEHFEPLSRCPETRWWTGVRISSENETQYECELVALNRSFSIGSWRQTPGVWTPFPWAIPALMAMQCNVELRVRPITGNAGHTSMRVSYQEMTNIDHRHFTFVNDTALCFYWDGNNAKLGVPRRNYNAACIIDENIYFMVPRLQSMIDNNIQELNGFL